MEDFYGFNNRSGFSRLPSPIRAALIMALGLLILNIITFLTAGAGGVVSIPLLALVYVGGGVLSAMFANSDGDARTPVVSGVLAGVSLWVISFLIDVVLSLVLAIPSLGLNLLLDVPYLCLCGPT